MLPRQKRLEKLGSLDTIIGHKRLQRRVTYFYIQSLYPSNLKRNLQKKFEYAYFEKNW